MKNKKMITSSSMYAGEQEIMRECIKSYSAKIESSGCYSRRLLALSWCDYNRGAIPK